MCETQGDSRSHVAKHGQTQGGPSKIVCSRNRISGRVIEPNRGRARSLEQARPAVRRDRAGQFLLPGRTPFFPRSSSFKKNALVLPRSKNGPAGPAAAGRACSGSSERERARARGRRARRPENGNDDQEDCTVLWLGAGNLRQACR